MKKRNALTDEENAIVAQNNELVTATYDLSVDEFRLLTLMLSKIEQRKFNPGWFDIYPIKFKNMFDVNPKNIWRSLTTSAKSLSKKQITFHKISRNDRNDRNEFTILNWLGGYYYVSKKGKQTALKVKFNSELDPFLFNIASNFSYCFMRAISKLTNVMAFRLYLYVLNYKNHPLCKKKDHCEVYIPIDNFRLIFPNTSKRFDNLKAKTIEPAIRDINSNTDISMCWSSERKGRAVTGLKFAFVEEHSSQVKPIRPRLKRRPQVTKGSHTEGLWMEKNCELLYQYENELKSYDSYAKLEINDLRRAVEYSKYCKPNWHREKKIELELRAVK